MPITMNDLTSDKVLYAAAMESIFAWMQEHGVAIITAGFHGEGDSGDFEDYLDLNMLDESTGQERYLEVSNTLDAALAGAHEVSDAEDNAKGLKGLILNIARKIEHETAHGVDWWNNDGGQGSVEFILDGHGKDERYYRRGICLTVEERVVEFQPHYFAIAGATEAEVDAEPTE